MSLIEKTKCKNWNYGKIGTLVERALRNYYQLNEKYPDNIVLYRDDVSDGQF